VSSVLYALLLTAYPFASSNLSSIIIYRLSFIAFPKVWLLVSFCIRVS
jgi:hypothetical protein